MKKKISITINEKILRDIDSLIDNIKIKNRSQAIEYILQDSLGEAKTAVILAGGAENKLKFGNEFKPTVKIKNSTLIEEAAKKLRKSGFREIFIIGRHKVITRIFELLKDGSAYGVKINYIEEKQARGTADTLKHLKGKVEKNFLVAYADLVFNKINLAELWNSHVKGNAIATLMLTTHARPREKGVVKMEGSRIVNFVQKPKSSAEHLVFSPLFVCEPEIFEYAGNSLEDDIFPLLARRGMLQGHLSSVKELHVHSAKDVKAAKKLI